MAPDEFTPIAPVIKLAPTLPEDIEFGGGDGPDFDDLAFIAQLIMQRGIEGIDWSIYKKVAEYLVDETDAATIVKLMQNARVEVFVGE